MMLKFSSALETVAWLPLRLSPHLLGSNFFHPSIEGFRGNVSYILAVWWAKKKSPEPPVEEFLDSGFAMYVTFSG